MTEFLTDPTGNVRWIPYEISGIDWNYSTEVNIDDVWRQAYILYKGGFACDVTADEVRENEEENRLFTMVTPEMELLMKHYSPGAKDDHDLFRTAGEIEIALKKGNRRAYKNFQQSIRKGFEDVRICKR
jgi:predicted P-loop ATPase